MKNRREWEAAAAAVSTAIGLGIVPGRAAVFFFVQMGKASWIGVLTASALFGVLCGITAVAVSETGNCSFGSVCRLLSGRWLAAVYYLLMMIAAAAMLAESGKLAMLALPVRYAFWIGVAAAMGLSSMLCMRGMRIWGMLTIVLCAAFYMALAWDPRPVRFAGRYETVLMLRDSVISALILGALQAALCASVAAGGIVPNGAKRPRKLALRAGVMMFFFLSVVNAALLRGGEELLSQPMPTVILSARWGKPGFYICIFVKWICILATLNAALSALAGKTQKRRET